MTHDGKPTLWHNRPGSLAEWCRLQNRTGYQGWNLGTGRRGWRHRWLDWRAGFQPHLSAEPLLRWERRHQTDTTAPSPGLYISGCGLDAGCAGKCECLNQTAPGAGATQDLSYRPDLPPRAQVKRIQAIASLELG